MDELDLDAPAAPALMRAFREIAEIVDSARGRAEGSSGRSPAVDDSNEGYGSRAARALAALWASGVTRERMLRDAPRGIGEALGWDAGMIWTPAPGGAYLECRAFWGAGEIAYGDFARASQEMRFEPGLGLVGRVWEGRESAWIDDVTALPDYVRVGPARREGLRSTFITPLERNGEVLGVVEFYALGFRSPDPELVSAMHRAGDRIAQLLATANDEVAVVTEGDLPNRVPPAPILTFAVDARARILAADPVAASVAGRTINALLGRSLLVDFAERDVPDPTAPEHVFARLREGESVVRFRARFATSGGPCPAEWTCIALSADTTEAPLIIVTIALSGGGSAAPIA